MLLEVAMYVLGVWVYMRATRPLDAIGRWASLSLALFLPIAYVVNLVGGPPLSVPVLWVSAIVATAVFLIWTWWADSHRAPRTA